MRKSILSAWLGLVLVPLAACGPEGVDDLAPAPRTISVATVNAPMATEMSCASGAWAAFFQVDLAAARKLVPEQYDLKVSKSFADGVTDVAGLTVTTIACETFTWEGANYPTSMLLATLDLAGPPTGPKDATVGYGYMVLEQVTSPAFHARVAGHGERADLVKSIDFGGPTSNGRAGRLVEANGLGLQWYEADVIVLGSPILLPMRGVQYQQIGASGSSAAMSGDTDCIEHLDGVGTIANMHPFALQADARSRLGRLGLGTTFTGLAVDASLVTCTGHVYRIAK